MCTIIKQMEQSIYKMQSIYVFIDTSNDEVLVIKLGCFGY